MVFQLLLYDPLGAALTFLVLILSTCANLFLQWLALWQVEGISRQARPLAAAIRDGEPLTLELEEIVVGDVLVVGPGDEFVAQGRVLAARDLLIDRPTTEAERQRVSAGEGDDLPADSYCVGGWAVYEVQAPPTVKTVTESIAEITVAREHRSSLQNIVNRILQAMAVIVIVLLIVLFVGLAGWGGEMTDEMLAIFRSNIGRVLSLAPGSLYLGIAVSYAASSGMLTRIGALIRDPRFVESLAQMTTLFFGRASVWARTDVEVEMLPPPPEHKGLPEERVRQLLGTYARSTRADDIVLRSIRRAISGQPRAVAQEATYLESLGWRGITFDEPDIEGTYVLGVPALFQEPLVEPAKGDEAEADAEQRPGVWARMRGRLSGHSEAESEAPQAETQSGSLWRRLLRSSPTISEAAAQPAEALPPAEAQPAVEMQPAVETQPVAEQAPEAGPQARGLRQRLRSILRRPSKSPEPQPEAEADPRLALVFAYSPDPRPLFTENAWPALPSDLFPICTLRFDQQAHPETLEVLRAAMEENIRIKLFSPNNPELAVAAIQQVVPDDELERELCVASGAELAAMDANHLVQSVREASVFGPISADQQAELVRVLREDGEEVAMVGDAMDDVPAMRQANVSMAFRTSGRAVLGGAGIVILDETPRVLLQVVGRARLSINSLLNSLKLNLTQIVYVLLLQLIIMWNRRADFFYHPSHGGIIAAFAVILPGLVLPFWSVRKLVPRASLVPRLVRFVLPAGLTLVAAVLALDYVFTQAGTEVLVRQNAVTLAMVAMGLILFVYLQPPLPRSSGRAFLGRDWRFVLVALAMGVLYLLFMSIPLMQRLLHLTFLPRTQDYVIVALVVVVWAEILRLLWRIPGLDPYK
jgi:magnesium-transporting ATPase (P-type)